MSADLPENAFRGVRHFAREMLEGDRLLLSPPLECLRPLTAPPDPSCKGLSAILFRSGCWQVEMIASLPDVDVPAHRHPNVHTADVLISGGGLGESGARSLGKSERRGSLVANLKTIPAGMAHSGKIGPQGVVYLSFQKWINGIAPSHLLFDWEAA